MRARHLPALPVVAAVSLAAMVASGCGREAGPGDAEVADNAVAVTVAIARVETLRDVIVLPGIVAPATLGDWTIHAPEAGVVAELTKAEGDPVVTGELLVRFDILSITQQITAKQALLGEAEQRREEAQREMDRQQALFDQGLVARNTYEATRSALGAAEAQVTQAEAELELAETFLDTTRVTARFDGVVASVWKTEGDFTSGSPNDPVMRVVDPTRTQIVAELAVEQAPRVVAGQVASVEGPLPEGPIAATVSRVDLPSALADTMARVRLDYESPVPLALDTPVRVELVIDQRTDAVAVPMEAILRDAAGPYVLIAGADLVAHRRDVRLGLAVDALVQITQGLDAGERVIVSGADAVVDGQTIRVGR